MTTLKTIFYPHGGPVAPRLARIESQLDAGDTNGALNGITGLGHVKTLCKNGHAEPLRAVLSRLSPDQRDQVISPEGMDLVERTTARSAGKRIGTQIREDHTRRLRQFTSQSLGGQS